MTTQLFKAKDVRSAIGLVTEEFGDDAIILSTKKNNGIVEIEASNNNEVLTSFPRKREENKTFTKIFHKKLDEKKYNFSREQNTNKKSIPTFDKKSRERGKIDNDDISSIRKEILGLRKEISSMILTDDSSLCDRLSFSVPIKLKQQRFSSELVRNLSYSYQGKNLEEGKVSFFRELSKKLSSIDFNRVLNTKNILVFGNSGCGKSTLSAKLASYISDTNKCKNINLIDVSNSSTSHSETLRGYSRVLGFKMINYNNFNFNKKENESNSINIFDFSGDLDFSLNKINEIKNSYKDFDFCSILAIQSGSNSAMINNIWSKVSDIKPMIAITKLDECWTGAEELSSLALNNARIGLFTGTKIIIDSILPINENSLTKYMKENFQSV
jgi:flagellar biosynthesis GTPase FlhF